MWRYALISLLVVLLGCVAEEHPQSEDRVTDIAYLWSLVKRGSQPVTEDITIRGTVVATDKLDEVSHCIVVADDSGGIEIAIDAESINPLIPLHSRVEVVASGLYIGRQGDKCLLGKRPTGQYVVDRIPERELPLYIKMLPEGERVAPKRLEIDEIAAHHLLHYVVVEGVRFVDEEMSLAWCDRDVEGRYINTIRHLTDGVDTLRVICSGECRYAEAELPHGTLKCCGIVDYAFGDIALRITDNQVITIGD